LLIIVNSTSYSSGKSVPEGED